MGRMLQFPSMKKLAVVVLRYALAALAAEAVVAVVMVAYTLDRGRFTTILASLRDVPLSSLPLACIAASALSFFPLNRLFARRFWGYLVLVVLNAVSMITPLALVWLGWMKMGNPAAFPPQLRYDAIASWYMYLPDQAPLWGALYAGAFCFLVSSIWGLSRLSAKRPLWGAFLTPCAVAGLLFLLDTFLSGIAADTFALIGLNPGPLSAAALLCAVSSMALLLFDALLCPPTEKGRIHG